MTTTSPHKKRVGTAKEHLAGIRAGAVWAQEMAARHLAGLAVKDTPIEGQDNPNDTSHPS